MGEKQSSDKRVDVVKRLTALSAKHDACGDPLPILDHAAREIMDLRGIRTKVRLICDETETPQGERLRLIRAAVGVLVLMALAGCSTTRPAAELPELPELPDVELPTYETAQADPNVGRVLDLIQANVRYRINAGQVMMHSMTDQRLVDITAGGAWPDPPIFENPGYHFILNDATLQPGDQIHGTVVYQGRHQVLPWQIFSR